MAGQVGSCCMLCKVGTRCSALPGNMLREGHKTCHIVFHVTTIDMAVSVACRSASTHKRCALQLMSTVLLGFVFTMEASRCKTTYGEQHFCKSIFTIAQDTRQPACKRQLRRMKHAGSDSGWLLKGLAYLPLHCLKLVKELCRLTQHLVNYV